MMNLKVTSFQTFTSIMQQSSEIHGCRRHKLSSPDLPVTVPSSSPVVIGIIEKWLFSSSSLRSVSCLMILVYLLIFNNSEIKIDTA